MRCAVRGVSLDVDGPTAWPYTPSEAFTRWVLPEVDVLYRVARSLTGQAADAEDLVQDTLVRAYRAIGTFDGRHPRAWLLTILRNTARNRSREARPRLFGDHDHVELYGAEAAPDECPEYVAVDRSFDAVVAQAF